MSSRTTTHKAGDHSVIRPVRDGIVAAAVVLICILAAQSVLYWYAARCYTREIRDGLEHLAAVVAASVDPELHAALTDRAQENSDTYRRAVAPLRAIAAAAEDIRFIYTMRTVDGKIHFVLDPSPPGDSNHDGVDDHSYLMDAYDTPTPAMLRALSSNRPESEEELSADKWGVFISGFAPIRDKDGREIGIAGVDLNATNYQRRMVAIRRVAMAGCGIGLLLASAVGGVVYAFQARAKRTDARRRAMQEQLVAAKHEAEAAAKTESEFLTNMSHEIRTPLTAILGFTDLLADPACDKATREEFVRTVRRNGEHLLRLINDILDLARVRAGRFTIERGPCQPKQVAQDVIELMLVEASAKGVRLELEIDAAVADTIISDSLRMRQIILNLVGNAIKFTEKGRVLVRLQRREVDGTEKLCVAVSDTGIGVDAETLGRLFRPFVQADRSVTRKFGGTGLGLALSRSIAELLGGTVEAQSRPGAGSTFTLIIPMERASIAETTQGGLDGSGARAERAMADYRVLIVEDAEDVRQFIQIMCQYAGANVEMAENGQIAVQRIVEEKRSYDVVLMDMQMPVLDGYAATTQLRAAGYRGAIIALTAHAMAGDQQKCLAAGCNSYLSKPVRREDLLAAIRCVSEPGKAAPLAPATGK